MFGDIFLPWDTLYKIIFNTIFVSFPEKLFLVLFTLYFTGEFEFLQSKHSVDRKTDLHFIFKIFVTAVVPSLLSNVLRYTGQNLYLSLILLFVVMYAMMIVLFDLWSYVKGLAKAFIFLALAVFIVAVIESAYIPFVLFTIKKSIMEIYEKVLWNTLITVPERIIEFCIIAFLLSKKATVLKAKIVKIILESTWLTVIVSGVIIFDVAYMAVMVNLACYQNILESLTLELRVLTILLSLLFPVINILALPWCIYIRENKTRTEQDAAIDKIEKTLDRISEIDANNDDFASIKISLQEIQCEIRNLKVN